MNIYETIARTARVPSTQDVSKALGVPLEDVRAAFERLHQKRLLVPEPGDPAGEPDRIRMAPPFSGIETPFRVKVQEKLYYANCAWDALGVAAALHDAAVVEASDAQSGEPIVLDIRPDGPVTEPCVIHFAVPAARWWEDIVYT
jgi:DNA-binding transcriptional MocR family regulator